MQNMGRAFVGVTASTGKPGGWRRLACCSLYHRKIFRDFSSSSPEVNGKGLYQVGPYICYVQQYCCRQQILGNPCHWILRNTSRNIYSHGLQFVHSSPVKRRTVSPFKGYHTCYNGMPKTSNIYRNSYIIASALSSGLPANYRSILNIVADEKVHVQRGQILGDHFI